MEIREIAGYPNYRIGNDGSVWSQVNRAGNPTGNWVQLNPHTEKNGYRRVLLSDNGKTRKQYIHRLVLEAFVGPRPSGMEAFHINNIRNDNRVENLKWETRKNNLGHRENFGTVPRGITHGNAVFTEDQVREIRRLRESGLSYQKIADHYRRSMYAVACIIKRVTWKHVI